MNNVERIIREKAYIAQRKKIIKKQKMPIKSHPINHSVKNYPKKIYQNGQDPNFKKIIGVLCIVLAVILLLVRCTANTEKKEKSTKTVTQTEIPTAMPTSIPTQITNKTETNPEKVVRTATEDSNNAQLVKNGGQETSDKTHKNADDTTTYSAKEAYYEHLQNFNVPTKVLRRIWKDSTKSEQAFAKSLTIWSIETFKGTSEREIFKIIKNNTPRDEIFGTELYKKTFEIYNQFIYDIKYFPIPKGYQYTFEDTWAAPRTYNGDRKHYGADIMEPKNKNANTKIISMTDGVIENIGWNELGGYRVGVRSESGAYFYYAHLAKMPTHIKKGDPVRAGDYLGLMGNTGYGIEGTSGKFPVHLHIGIAVTLPDNKEFWINPYYLLRYIENKRIKVFTI